MLNALLPPEIRKKNQEELEIRKAKQDKLSFIQKYIDMGNEVLECKDINKVNEYCDNCIGLFTSEINGFMNKLETSPYDNYSCLHVKLIINKLEKYKIDFQLFNNQIKENKSINFNNQNINNINLEININQTISNIMNVSEKELSLDDKMNLAQMLKEIEQSKKKDGFWDKIKSAIKWVLEKGVETTIATLPYLLGVIK
jgi:ATP-dependent Lon protease